MQCNTMFTSLSGEMDDAKLGETALQTNKLTNVNTNPCGIPDSTGVTTISNSLQNETCQSCSTGVHTSLTHFLE